MNQPKYKPNGYDIILFCATGILLVGELSRNLFADAFGEAVAMWYIVTIMTLSFPFYVFIQIAQINYIRASRDAFRFDKYRGKTVAKLKKLGCNPEVLDKITEKITNEVIEEFKKE